MKRRTSANYQERRVKGTSILSWAIRSVSYRSIPERIRKKTEHCLGNGDVSISAQEQFAEKEEEEEVVVVVEVINHWKEKQFLTICQQTMAN